MQITFVKHNLVNFSNMHKQNTSALDGAKFNTEL